MPDKRTLGLLITKCNTSSILKLLGINEIGHPYSGNFKLNKLTVKKLWSSVGILDSNYKRGLLDLKTGNLAKKRTVINLAIGKNLWNLSRNFN